MAKIPLDRWHQAFKETAKSCKEQVGTLPKGQRFAKYLECMKTNLRTKAQQLKA